MPIAVEPIVFQPQWKDSGKLALACVTVRAKHDLKICWKRGNMMMIRQARDGRERETFSSCISNMHDCMQKA